VIIALATTTLVLGGCGEDLPTGLKTKTKKEGRIYWDNTTNRRMKVDYFNEDMGKLVQTSVEPYTKEDISQAVLKGGTEISLKWNVGNTLWGTVDVTVDNNVTVKVTGFRDPNTDPKNRLIYVLLAG